MADITKKEDKEDNNEVKAIYTMFGSYLQKNFNLAFLRFNKSAIALTQLN